MQSSLPEGLVVRALRPGDAEALHALKAPMVECSDQSLGLRRLELEVFADNEAAIALYGKFGFVVEGRSCGAAIRDGVLADTLHMARYAQAPAF